MKKIALLILPVAAGYSVPAAASEKDNRTYEAMISCFDERASSVDDLTTPVGDMADVIIGMCWEKVSEHRVRWISDWGMNWAAFIGPYFTLQITAKAKEAVYVHRKAIRQRPSG